MVFLPSRRLSFGSSAYWQHRRRVVVRKLRSQGYIAEVGPAGQVFWQQHVGQVQAERWWRRVEADPRGWLLSLLLGLAIALQLQVQVRSSTYLVGFGAALPLLGFGLVRCLGRPPGYGPGSEF